MSGRLSGKVVPHDSFRTKRQEIMARSARTDLDQALIELLQSRAAVERIVVVVAGKERVLFQKAAGEERSVA